MRFWGTVQSSAKDENWLLSLAPPCTNWYEYSRANVAAVFADAVAVGRRLFSVPRHYAFTRKEFLLWIFGAAKAEAPRLVRCVCLHAPLRRYCGRSLASRARSPAKARRLA